MNNLSAKEAILQEEVELLKKQIEIEASLEKIRAKTMAMQRSEDLANLSMELVKQVQTFGLHSWFCAFNIYDDDSRGSIEWGSNGQGTFPQYRTPREGVFLKYYEAGQSGQEFLVNPIGENECAAHYEYLCSLPVVGETLLQMKDNGIPFPTSQIDHVAFFKYGYVLFITYEPAPEAHDIFKRFAKVFEQSYTRFLDLQKAEAQTKEAQIESALEKVRSSSLAMHNSKQIREIVKVVFEKLKELEFAIDGGVFVATISRKLDSLNYWIGDDHAEYPSGFAIPKHDTPMINDVWNAVKTEVEFISKTYSFKEKNSWFEYAFNHTDLKTALPEDFKKWILEQEYLTQLFAIQKNSGIGVHFHHERTLTEKEVDILKRFSKVFEQSYVRFLDLQKAEAQAIIAKKNNEEIEKAYKELKATQAQLIQSEKMASLGELTAGIAHEIQNPLNFVNNFSEVTEELVEEVLEERKKEKGERDEGLEEEILGDIKENLIKIHHHGNRASSIVKGMLEHSRTSTGKKELTDINALADEYLRLAYHGLRAKDSSFNSDFQTDFDPNIPKIEVIPQDIGRVLLNLINNAFQAIMEKGEWKKENGDKDYKPLVTVSTQLTAQGSLLITIKDNGPGIPDAIKDKIFQPFFTTKDTGKGTGLGLSLAYDIVTKGHGGEIKVESEANHGTSFTIKLPKS